MGLKSSALDKLPYYQHKPADGRAILVCPFCKDAEIHLPMPNQHGEEIVFLKPTAFVKGSYFAKEIVDLNADVHIPLYELIIQRYSFKVVLDIVQTIVNDILNFSAILEKHDLVFRDSRRQSGQFHDHSLLIGTELEFQFYNVRSLYDRLQAVIKAIWDDTTLHDRSLKKRELPLSFRDVILCGKDDRVRSVDEIITRYGLPSPLADFYHSQGEFFKSCRAIRNKISHSGYSVSDQGPIFLLDQGFAVDATQYPFSKFECWSAGSLRNDKLGSVRALMAHIASRAIDATSVYATTLISCIQLPDPIAPDWHVYVRGSYISHLHHLSNYVIQPWLNEAADAQERTPQ